MSAEVTIYTTQNINVTVGDDDVIAVTVVDGNQQSIQFQDEGLNLGSAGTVQTLNFTGSGVSATRTGNGIEVSISAGGGSGDVVGPALSVDSHIAEFSGVTGKLLKDGGVTISAFIKTLLDDADKSAARATLGLFNYADTVAQSLTGTTNETLMASASLGTTLQAGDIMEVWVAATKSGTAGTYTIRINMNDSASLSGDTTIAIAASASNSLWGGVIRRFHVVSASSQIVFAVGVGSTDEAAFTINAHSALTLDLTVAKFLTVSIQNGSAADTSTLRGWFYRIIRA